MSNTLNRKIYFYQLSQSLPDQNGKAKALDIGKLFQGLSKLKDDDNAMAWGEDDQIETWVNKNTAPYELIIGRTRKTNLPRKTKGRKLKELILSKDEGLVELCHMVFFSNGIVGVEYNHNGPRISAFKEYVFDKFKVQLFYTVLSDRDSASILNNLNGLTEVNIRVSPSALVLNTNGAGDLIDSLKKIGNSSNGDQVEIKIKNEISRKKNAKKVFLDHKIIQDLKKLFKPNAEFHGIERIDINGEDKQGRMQFKNLFEEQFVFEVALLKLDNCNAVNKQDAFKKIKKIYIDNQMKILRCNQVKVD